MTICAEATSRHISAAPPPSGHDAPNPPQQRAPPAFAPDGPRPCGPSRRRAWGLSCLPAPGHSRRSHLRRAGGLCSRRPHRPQAECRQSPHPRSVASPAPNPHGDGCRQPAPFPDPIRRLAERPQGGVACLGRASRGRPPNRDRKAPCVRREGRQRLAGERPARGGNLMEAAAAPARRGGSRRGRRIAAWGGVGGGEVGGGALGVRLPVRHSTSLSLRKQRE